MKSQNDPVSLKTRSRVQISSEIFSPESSLLSLSYLVLPVKSVDGLKAEVVSEIAALKWSLLVLQVKLPPEQSFDTDRHFVEWSIPGLQRLSLSEAYPHPSIILRDFPLNCMFYVQSLL